MNEKIYNKTPKEMEKLYESHMDIAYKNAGYTDLEIKTMQNNLLKYSRMCENAALKFSSVHGKMVNLVNKFNKNNYEGRTVLDAFMEIIRLRNELDLHHVVIYTMHEIPKLISTDTMKTVTRSHQDISDIVERLHKGLISNE